MYDAHLLNIDLVNQTIREINFGPILQFIEKRKLHIALANTTKTFHSIHDKL